MIDPLTTFVGSAGGGLMSGAAKAIISFMIKRSLDKKEEKLQTLAIASGNAESILKARIKVAEMKPIKYSTKETWSRPKYIIFGEAITFSKETTHHKISQLPSEKTVNSAFMLFSIFYCCCVAVYLYKMTTLFPATNPQGGGGFSVLGLFNFHWGKNKMIEYSGGGAGLYLLSPMIMWITHVVTGKTLNTR